MVLVCPRFLLSTLQVIDVVFVTSCFLLNKDDSMNKWNYSVCTFDGWMCSFMVVRLLLLDESYVNKWNVLKFVLVERLLL